MIVKVNDLVPGETRPLDEIDVTNLSEEEFWSTYVCKHRPLVIRGGIKHWAACEKWQEPQYLQSISNSVNGSVRYRRAFNSNPVPPITQKMELREALNALIETPHDKTFAIPGMNLPKRWKEDIGNYPFLQSRIKRKPIFYQLNRLFLFRNASTDWHTHPADETICSQIVGSKKVSMFRCTDKNWDKYAPYIEKNIHHMSLDESYFPDKSDLIKFEGVLQEGDSLYIPPFWWHALDSNDTEFGINLARCFRSPLSRVGDFNEPVLKDLRKYTSIRQQIWVDSLIILSSLNRKFKGETW
ncbi:cupin-like domain-containing protein [Marinibactrum halimedae]|uniref:JmjC domain-containing protein n=1 Tax=Marinibactrum halimedae TaxID=1444977 RepID=A0AA37WMQ6_9GAMM|nr:cupin-like domain-containing protein [Marinibactrum halimedae]MCD9458494.1 cupin-like domain-containing protein [Marinibactrum halimedae]GLS26643.1 hypothetical protein GCM10007877_23590 [Marinibactrum halimedae]